MTNDKRPERNNDSNPRPKREVMHTVLACIAILLVTCFVAIYQTQFGKNQSDIFNVAFLMVAVGGIAVVAQLAGILLKSKESLLTVLLRKIGLAYSFPLMVIGITIAGMGGYTDAMAYGTDSFLWGVGCLMAAIGGFAIVANESIRSTGKKSAIVFLALAVGFLSGLTLSEPLAHAMEDKIETHK